MYTWKMDLVSNTYAGEDVGMNMREDKISDPEEDSLAGQMSVTRGGPAQKAPAGSTQEESDEESSVDDDEDIVLMIVAMVMVID
ncbi:hypothetical protein D9758_003833 [Tetrapyrgos nigripes]|uniref:Uncharacterized protein n=1 Tax=Tetrapyrgos nigripes TaxID=182062 RepID=A0A8H5GLW9_9AGAR|nr:hypothetical protein D9758_003833 [Tetrapyrgos nigripes]